MRGHILWGLRRACRDLLLCLRGGSGGAGGSGVSALPARPVADHDGGTVRGASRCLAGHYTCDAGENGDSLSGQPRRKHAFVSCPPARLFELTRMESAHGACVPMANTYPYVALPNAMP